MADNETNVTTETNEVGQLQRSALLHFLQTPFALPLAAEQSWYKIGKHVSDMSVNLNPQTETIKNILDETEVNDNGYEPAYDVDTYYANPKDAIYDDVKNISLNRKKGDDCKTVCMEVLIDKTEGPFDAWIEDVVVKTQSYGGQQGGVRFPFNVAFCGNRIKGTVTFDATGKPTFTAAV